MFGCAQPSLCEAGNVNWQQCSSSVATELSLHCICFYIILSFFLLALEVECLGWEH